MIGDIRRYHNEFDWAEIEGKPLNKLNIWSKYTNSGNLELHPNTGQLSLLSKYPITSTDGTTQQVLVSRKEDRYSVNYFYNRLLKSNSNNPHFNWDRNQILKEVVQKVPNQATAIRFYNYPYAAFEESLVNG